MLTQALHAHARQHGSSGHGIRVGDWGCPRCREHNFSNRKDCFKCGAVKPKLPLHMTLTEDVAVLNRRINDLRRKRNLLDVDIQEAEEELEMLKARRQKMEDLGGNVPGGGGQVYDVSRGHERQRDFSPVSTMSSLMRGFSPDALSVWNDSSELGYGDVDPGCSSASVGSGPQVVLRPRSPVVLRARSPPRSRADQGPAPPPTDMSAEKNPNIPTTPNPGLPNYPDHWKWCSRRQKWYKAPSRERFALASGKSTSTTRSYQDYPKARNYRDRPAPLRSVREEPEKEKPMPDALPVRRRVENWERDCRQTFY